MLGADEDAGSSPRGRGKRQNRVTSPRLDGLIPAWAGKTAWQSWTWTGSSAHPRVGGENSAACMASADAGGSSPRGRGKLPPSICPHHESGLIPAWAGKTSNFLLGLHQDPAHPRVGGENVRARERAIAIRGSSPRGRGKHFLTCAFIERIGQILETLELAVSSESYTLSAAYATDAPQDQARNTALVLPSSRGAS